MVVHSGRGWEVRSRPISCGHIRICSTYQQNDLGAWVLPPILYYSSCILRRSVVDTFFYRSTQTMAQQRRNTPGLTKFASMLSLLTLFNFITAHICNSRWHITLHSSFQLSTNDRAIFASRLNILGSHISRGKGRNGLILEFCTTSCL